MVGDINPDLVRIKLVKDIQNWDGSLSYHKDLELLVDPTKAQALVLSRAAVKVSGQPSQENRPARPASG